jgi:dolichol-phosphate mannosyltransferase
MKTINVICPVYNDEECINIFYDEIKKVINEQKNYNFKIIFSDNNSTDKSYHIISKICKLDKKVSLIKLSKNFGYQKSMFASLTALEADAYIFIDVDCEDPPEMINDFINYWEKGFDVVYGIRELRTEPKHLQLLRKLYYRLVRLISDYDFILDMAEFSLIDSKVRNELIKNNDTYPFLRNEIAYLGYRKYGIKYKRQARVAGKSNYNYWSMLTFGVTGMLTSSTFFLRINVFFLATIFIINILYLISGDKHGISLEFILISNLSYISYAVCFISLYISRIYKNTINRVRYSIDFERSINLD